MLFMPKMAEPCPTQDEVPGYLTGVTELYHYSTCLIVHRLDGCGLRVTEPVSLRIKTWVEPGSPVRLSGQGTQGAWFCSPAAMRGFRN